MRAELLYTDEFQGDPHYLIDIKAGEGLIVTRSGYLLEHSEEIHRWESGRFQFVSRGEAYVARLAMAA